MSLLSGIWQSFLDLIATALESLHNGLEPLFGTDAAWGWAIIALTLLVRTLLLPLAVKQIRSMKGMQAIQPKVKAIQEKYKVDRDLLKKDPERYQKLKAEQNEKLMELYKEEGVNPASSCLPLLLQMPIFFALFDVLRGDGERLQALAGADFYFFTDRVGGLGGEVGAAGWPGWLLIVLMAGTMFLTQRQMMARNQAEGPQATQQKIMMYVFPIFLAGISFNFPLAVVLYWVTTNIWQSAQQYVMLRTAAEETPTAVAATTTSGPEARTKGGATRTKSTPSKATNKPAKTSSKGGSHLPRRKSD